MKKLSIGPLIAIAWALSSVAPAGAVTITYSGIQEELHTSAYARAGPSGGSAGVSDLKSDHASTTPYWVSTRRSSIKTSSARARSPAQARS